MESLLEQIEFFLENLGFYGGTIGALLVVVESIFPILPLFMFVGIVFYAFGTVFGFLISYICTILGCIISYYIFKRFSYKFDYLIINNEKVRHYTDLFKNISLSKFILLVSIPFTPAFLVNVVSGLTKMDFRKFIIGMVVGKISLVYYLGFLGTSLIECLHNPVKFIRIIIIVLVIYLISKIIEKVFKF